MALSRHPSNRSNFPTSLQVRSGRLPLWLWSFVRVAACLAVIALIGVGGTSYFWLKNLGVFSLDKSRVSELQHFSFADNTIVFDRHGEKIGEFFDRYQVYIPANELPLALKQAIFAIEDRNFMTHAGIDTTAMVRAGWSRLKKNKTTQGASTITQQVAKQMILTSERTIERKILEIAWALKLEKTLSKDQILQIYTNNMFLGNGAYGVGAAALRYFGKDVRSLSIAESALIAGLFQSPSRYNPAKYPERAKNRQLSVIRAMVATDYLTQAQALAVQNAPLNYQEYKSANYETAPWFVDAVYEFLPQVLGQIGRKTDGKGLRVYTTLDRTLQGYAESAVAGAESTFAKIDKGTEPIIDRSTGAKKRARVEAAMLVTDPQNGEILAMVGGRNYKTSQFNRALNAMRSPGSAFKPVIYTEALMRGFSWSDVIFVSPVNISNYRPRTPDDDYLSETTMLRAFYRSMNAPTIEIATQVGLSAVINRAKSLGIRTPIKPEFGSVLGSSDTTMPDLARMYNVFASDGHLTELSTITKVTDSEGKTLFQAAPIDSRRKKVLTPQISYLMTEGMKSVLRSGTASKSSDLANVAAGKTGTSNNSEDNWFCGYTQNLSALVWVGTDEHVPIFANVTGAAVALPIWDVFMRQAFRQRPPGNVSVPPGLTSMSIHPLYGHRISRGTQMWFLDGTQPKETASALESIENKSAGAYRRVFRH